MCTLPPQLLLLLLLLLLHCQQRRQPADHEPQVSPSLLLAEKRQAEAARIRDKYPDRIPVSALAAAAVPAPLGTVALRCHGAGSPLEQG